MVTSVIVRILLDFKWKNHFLHPLCAVHFPFGLLVDLGAALGLLCRRILFARSPCSRCFAYKDEPMPFR
jgi:hypothetical protein